MPLSWFVRMFIVGCVAIPALGFSADEKHNGALVELLADYFRARHRSDRRALLQRIRKASGDSIAAVAAALPQLQLWDPTDASSDEFEVVHASGRPVRIAVTLPADYDSKRRYPLVLALCDSTVDPAEPSQSVWPPAFAGFIIAAPQDIDGDLFRTGYDTAAAPTEWLAALRRRYHVDSDRVYLYGCGARGDAAFSVLLMHSDLFAGALIQEGTLDIPYRHELQRLLLTNLRDTPLHLTWTEPDMPPNTPMQGRLVKVAIANRSIIEFAQEEHLPISKTVRLLSEQRGGKGIGAKARKGGGMVEPSSAETGGAARATATGAGWRVFDQARLRPVKEAGKWFRYPAQGHAGFLRQHAFTPPIWIADQIDFLVHPGVDRSAFITRFFESKLARLAGRIDGQRIEITSTHSESVELRIEPGMVDFDRPVSITCNGKRRFADRLRPSIATLLKSAYTDWEFQHPIYVRLRVGDSGRVLPF